MGRVVIAEEGGLSLSLTFPAPPFGMVSVVLEGPTLRAAADVWDDPSNPECGTIQGFFAAAAERRPGVIWRAIGEDFELHTGTLTDGSFVLRVFLDSTGNNTGAWNVSASLALTQETLDRAAADAAAVFGVSAG